MAHTIVFCGLRKLTQSHERQRLEAEALALISHFADTDLVLSVTEYNRLVIMLIAQITIHIKPEFVDAFRKASIVNAQNSLRETGIARFDVLQQLDDPTRFIFIEVYRTNDARAKHRETEHYRVWRDTVAEMMAEPRTSIELHNVFPDENGW